MNIYVKLDEPRPNSAENWTVRWKEAWASREPPLQQNYLKVFQFQSFTSSCSFEEHELLPQLMQLSYSIFAEYVPRLEHLFHI